MCCLNMYVSNDVCVSCTKTIKTCHKIIYCKHCKLHVHKKCTNLKQSELKRLNPGDWEFINCSVDNNETVTDIYSHDIDIY